MTGNARHIRLLIHTSASYNNANYYSRLVSLSFICLFWAFRVHKSNFEKQQVLLFIIGVRAYAYVLVCMLERFVDKNSVAAQCRHVRGPGEKSRDSQLATHYLPAFRRFYFSYIVPCAFQITHSQIDHVVSSMTIEGVKFHETCPHVTARQQKMQ